MIMFQKVSCITITTMTLLSLSLEEASAFSIGSNSIFFSRTNHKFQSKSTNPLSHKPSPSSKLSSTTSPPSSVITSSSSILCPGSKFYQLEEMEDRDNCTTEIFLGKDGTVAVTDTDGPPPVRSFGTWKALPSSASVGDDTTTGSFEMKITRTYSTGTDSSDIGEFCFDVERSFVGEMASVGGLVSVTGSMHLLDDFFGDTEVGFFSMIDTTDAKLGDDQE